MQWTPELIKTLQVAEKAGYAILCQDQEIGLAPEDFTDEENAGAMYFRNDKFGTMTDVTMYDPEDFHIESRKRISLQDYVNGGPPQQPKLPNTSNASRNANRPDQA